MPPTRYACCCITLQGLTIDLSRPCQILQDKMEKQRLDRIKAEARQAAKKEKLAAEGELDAQFVPVADRRTGRTAAEEATITERKKGDAKGKAKDVGKRKVEKLEMENALEEAVGSTSVRLFRAAGTKGS